MRTHYSIVGIVVVVVVVVIIIVITLTSQRNTKYVNDECVLLFIAVTLSFVVFFYLFVYFLPFK